MDFETIKPRPPICRQSSIACALACTRKWWYQYRMGIILRGEQVKESATLGTIYHQLQCLGPGSESSVKAGVQRKQTALMDRVNKGEDLDGQMARLAGLLTELYDKAEAMARIFWEMYPQPSYFEILGSEVFHSMEVSGFTLEGTIDKILLDTQRRDVWIRDHKSTGRSLVSLFGGIAWSLQARIYRLLAEDYLNEYQPGWVKDRHHLRGFILDGILKPGIKLCRTDEKNAQEWNVPIRDAYLRRVKEWYKEKGEAAVLSKGIIYTEPPIPDELKTLFGYMKVLFVRGSCDPGRFPRDSTRRECFAYETQCPYHDLCDVDPIHWDRLFETKYRFQEEENENTEDVVPDSDVG